MVDSIPPIFTLPLQPVTPEFDTAAFQIAWARAQALATNTNEIAFLQEITKMNGDTNALAFDSTSTAPSATDAFLSNGLLNLDPAADPTIDPSAGPSTLSLFSEFGADLTSATSDSIKAQQMHDIGVLQHDTALLEEAATANSHLPLGASASTVDLSLEAQSIVSGITVGDINGSVPLFPAQLAQLAAMLQPVAGQPLTASLLQQIQTQLAASGQNPIQLSLNTIYYALNYIAGTQPSQNHAVENTIIQENTKTVAPVLAIDRVAVEDSAIR